MALIRREDALAAINAVAAYSSSTLCVKAACYASVKTDSVVPTVDAVEVVRCKDCESCFELADTDPMIPYRHRDNADGFFCAAQDTDFYAPAYNAGTYYCADGRARRG